MAGTAQPSLVKPLDDERSRAATLENLYGSAVAMGREIDVQLLSQFRRPPGLSSSFLGLRSLTSQLDQCPWPEMVTAVSSPAAPAGLSESCAQGALHHKETASPFTVAHEAMERDVGLRGAPFKAPEAGSSYLQA